MVAFFTLFVLCPFFKYHFCFLAFQKRPFVPSFCGGPQKALQGHLLQASSLRPRQVTDGAKGASLVFFRLCFRFSTGKVYWVSNRENLPVCFFLVKKHGHRPTYQITTIAHSFLPSSGGLGCQVLHLRF